MAPHTTFITGATGFLGSELLRRIISREPRTQVYVLVRGVDQAAAEARLSALLDELFPVPDQRCHAGSRVHAMHGDVCADQLGLEPDAYRRLAKSITDIYHMASDVRFNLPLETARDVNVNGASNVLDLALMSARIPGKPRISLHHVSTYAAGRPTWPGERVYEELAPRCCTFHNTYEQSKAETESMLVERAGNVLLYIYRPSIIVGDSTSGWTQDFKVGYLLMRSYFSYSSTVPLLLASGGLIDQVNVDYVADALHAISRSTNDCSGTIYHLVAGDHAVGSSKVFSEFAAALREVAIANKLPDVPRPLQIQLTDSVTTDALQENIADPEIRNLMLGFAPYFCNSWVYDNSNTHRALTRETGQSSLKPVVDFRMLAEFCLRTQWGRRPEKRPEFDRQPA